MSSYVDDLDVALLLLSHLLELYERLESKRRTHRARRVLLISLAGIEPAIYRDGRDRRRDVSRHHEQRPTPEDASAPDVAILGYGSVEIG
jgi:hypothetical protein